MPRGRKTAPVSIRIIYTAADGTVREPLPFKTVRGASTYARKFLGDRPEIGSDRATSADDGGTMQVIGCSLADLFPGATPPPASADTVEGLVAEMSALLDEVDTVLPKLPKNALNHWQRPPALLALDKRVEALCDRLERIVPKTSGWFNGKAVYVSYLAEPGRVSSPTWARPGRTIGWIGYVPVVLEWQGFLENFAGAVYALDPGEPWLDSSGSRAVYLASQSDKTKPLAEAFREILVKTAASPEFKLTALSEHGRDETKNRLEADEWLREALRIGPVDAIPMPDKYYATPLSIFR